MRVVIADQRSQIATHNFLIVVALLACAINAHYTRCSFGAICAHIDRRPPTRRIEEWTLLLASRITSESIISRSRTRWTNVTNCMEIHCIEIN